MVRLSELPSFTPAVVETVEHLSADDAIARRLADLGFVPGETVRITASGPVGADPLLVQVGFTRFALRRSEAARVRVQAVTP
ncbi:FeoA family protein [Perlucidibaca piscinae]|uniref:FeoA family protein n=1 Tax=Perlucidibaca piscinae TaxID=392589 RepID=UPI0003B3C479|nr:FeoA family protein [Perlucidibaca piscinae]